MSGRWLSVLKGCVLPLCPGGTCVASMSWRGVCCLCPGRVCVAALSWRDMCCLYVLEWCVLLLCPGGVCVASILEGHVLLLCPGGVCAASLSWRGVCCHSVLEGRVLPRHQMCSTVTGCVCAGIFSRTNPQLMQSAILRGCNQNQTFLSFIHMYGPQTILPTLFIYVIEILCPGRF